MFCWPHGNAGRIFGVSVGLFVCFYIAISGIFGVFEIWASLESEAWPQFHYVGVLILAVAKILATAFTILALWMRTGLFCRIAGWVYISLSPLYLIWLLVSWIKWSKHDYTAPSWEKSFWVAETIFVVLHLSVLYFLITAFWSIIRIRKVGGYGFEGKTWQRVVEYMKNEHKRQAERLVRADNWLATETQLHEKEKARQAERQKLHAERQKQNKQEQAARRAEDRKESAQRNAERKKDQAGRKAAEKSKAAGKNNKTVHHQQDAHQNEMTHLNNNHGETDGAAGATTGHHLV